jgi:hypothetical protein
MAVRPSLKRSEIFCAKDLNPWISSLDKYMTVIGDDREIRPSEKAGRKYRGSGRGAEGKK